MASTSDFLTAALAQVPDGDKGDISIVGGVWNIDADADTQTFVQATPAAVWNFTHQLNRTPSVQVTSLAGVEVEAEVIIDNTSVEVRFAGPYAGIVNLT